MEDRKIIFLDTAAYSQQKTPEIIKTAFEIFYAGYLDRPGRENQFAAIGKIYIDKPISMNFPCIEPLIKSFVTDCHTAGSSLLMDITLLPPFNADALNYLNSIWTHLPVILSTYLSRISQAFTYKEKRESTKSAVYDFLYQISKQAYYAAAIKMYKRISA